MIWKVASLYIAAVIGAGFASGQEIIQFFQRFGRAGLIGLILATLALSILGGLILKKCYELKTSDYKALLFKVSGTEAAFLDLLYTTFLLAGLAIMLAGSKETIYILFGIPGGQYITALAVVYLLVRGPEKILNASALLIPFLIGYILFIGRTMLVRNGLRIPQESINFGIPYSLLYPGFNLGFALAIFASIADLLPNKKTAFCGGIVGGLVLGGLIGLMLLTLWSGPAIALSSPVPMLFIAERISKSTGLVYGIVLWIAMYTTAVANGLAVATRLKPIVDLSWTTISIIVVFLACLVSRAGFVLLISFAYPLFGFVGIYLIYRLLRYDGKT